MEKRKNNIVAMLIGLTMVLLPEFTFGQKPLSLEESRNLALEYNKTLKISALQKTEAVARKKEAFSNYLPKVDASGMAMYFPTMENIGLPGHYLPTGPEPGAPASNAYSPPMTIETEKLSILRGGVDLQQPIYAGGKIRIANKMAAKGVEISEQAFQLKESEVILNTDQAYWNLVDMREKVVLAEKYVQMLDSLEGQLNDSYELGLVPKSEKLRVTVQKNNAELNLLKAKNGYKILQMNFCQVVGLPLDSEIEVTDKVETEPKMPDTANSSEQALGKRQELAILQKQSEISEYQKKMVNAEFLPQLGAQVGYAYTQLGDLYEDGAVTMTASLSIPVFHWGEKKHKKSAAQARIEQANLNLDNTREMVQLEVQQVQIQLQEGFENILLSQKNKQEAKESLEETQVSFEVGLNTTTDLLNAQAAWQAAVAQEIDALTTFEVLKTKYKKVIGLL